MLHYIWIMFESCLIRTKRNRFQFSSLIHVYNDFEWFHVLWFCSYIYCSIFTLIRCQSEISSQLVVCLKLHRMFLWFLPPLWCSLPKDFFLIFLVPPLWSSSAGPQIFNPHPVFEEVFALKHRLPEVGAMCFSVHAVPRSQRWESGPVHVRRCAAE